MMGTRITGGEPPKDKQPPDPRAAWKKYPFPIEIGCMNRAHREIVHFEIPKGKKNAKCPKCGRRAGRP